MSNQEFVVFNPLTTLTGAHYSIHTDIQELVYYAESRFRAALLVIAMSPIDQQEWKQHFLCAEVVCNEFNLWYLFSPDIDIGIGLVFYWLGIGTRPFGHDSHYCSVVSGFASSHSV